jgi:hypothetical protein
MFLLCLEQLLIPQARCLIFIQFFNQATAYTKKTFKNSPVTESLSPMENNEASLKLAQIYKFN